MRRYSTPPFLMVFRVSQRYRCHTPFLFRRWLRLVEDGTVPPPGTVHVRAGAYCSVSGVSRPSALLTPLWCYLRTIVYWLFGTHIHVHVVL